MFGSKILTQHLHSIISFFLGLCFFGYLTLPVFRFGSRERRKMREKGFAIKTTDRQRKRNITLMLDSVLEVGHASGGYKTQERIHTIRTRKSDERGVYYSSDSHPFLSTFGITSHIPFAQFFTLFLLDPPFLFQFHVGFSLLLSLLKIIFLCTFLVLVCLFFVVFTAKSKQYLYRMFFYRNKNKNINT